MFVAVAFVYNKDGSNFIFLLPTRKEVRVTLKIRRAGRVVVQKRSDLSVFMEKLDSKKG
jgi:hypothetical protein